MDQVSQQTLPKSEAEVVGRMKIKPDRIKMTVAKDTDSDSARHWVILQFDFRGKLGGFGRFLSDRVMDVDQAGGVVTQIGLGTHMSPEEISRDPKGSWRSLHTELSIRTKLEVRTEDAAWDAAARDLFNQHKKKA